MAIPEEIKEDEGLLAYSLELLKWHEKGMVVFINFTNPLDVSTGEIPNQISFRFKNTSMFATDEIQYEVEATSLRLNMNLPK